MPRKEEESSGGAPEWMCTFSDMMSLLLCFFILLFAMSSVEKKKMVQAAGSLRAAFGGLPAPYLTETIPDKHTKPEMSKPAQTQHRTSYGKDELLVEEQKKVRGWNLQSVIKVTGTEQGITFKISGDALFARGSSELTDKGITVLYLITEELIQFPANPVTIDGHTDNEPSSRENGNWLLGADRAYNVMRYLVDIGSQYGQVDKKRVTYQSFSDSKPVPDVSKDTVIGKALNRRVEITLVQTDEGGGTYFANPLEKDPRTPLIHQDLDPN